MENVRSEKRKKCAKTEQQGLELQKKPSHDDYEINIREKRYLFFK